MQLENKANECLYNMQQWFTSNKLSLNYEKTCYTIFNRNCRSVNNVSLNILINGQPITRVKNCRYLGVIIDESLTWAEHIDSVYKQLLKFTGIFYKLRGILPISCLYKLYNAFIHPYIMYGIEVYANTTASVLDKLCKLNNKLLRILLNKPLLTPTHELYCALNTLPIPQLHQLRMLLFTHKCVYNGDSLPEIFRNYFTLNSSVHEHGTRQQNYFHLSVVRSSFGSRCTCYCCGKLWNGLPDAIKAISSINIFKKHIKQILYFSLT